MSFASLFASVMCECSIVCICARIGLQIYVSQQQCQIENAVELSFESRCVCSLICPVVLLDVMIFMSSLVVCLEYLPYNRFIGLLLLWAHVLTSRALEHRP